MTLSADTLAFRYASRTAGYDFGTERIFVSMVGNAPFNRDTIRDIEHAEISFKDSDGNKQRDIALKVSGHKSSQPLTHAQEQQGQTREVIVTITVPKGAAKDAMRAITAVAKKHKLKAERINSMRNPETQQGKAKGRGRSRGLLLASSVALAEAWREREAGSKTVSDKDVVEVAKMTDRNDSLGAYHYIASKVLKDKTLTDVFEAMQTLQRVLKDTSGFRGALQKMYERLKYVMKQKLDDESYQKLYGAT